MGAQERKRQRRIKEHVIIRDGLNCCYCSIPLTTETVTMEHIVPDSKRGTFNTTNLTVSCSKCNGRRGNKPFFDYCRQFNFSADKIKKYQNLYFSNLRIKVLNIAKETCLRDDKVVPNDIIQQACQVLKIRSMSFADYENTYQFEIKFNEVCDRKKIKFCFEQLIRIIEANSS